MVKRTLALLLVVTFGFVSNCSSPDSPVEDTLATTVPVETTTVPPTSVPAATPQPTAIVVADLPIIDMHFHPDTGWDMPTLLALLDELGVSRAVGGSGGNGATALSFAGQHSDRFVPFAGQDAVRGLYQTDAAAVINFESDRIVRHVAILKEGLKADCWAGIGEMFVNTLASHRTGAMRMPADSTLMRRLWELSATYSVPLSVHMDAAPASVAELRRLLALNPNGTWIWAHSGWYAEPALLREMLQAHPNLYLELSFRDELRSFFAVSSNGRLRESWRALLEEMPDRFLLGTDLLPPPTPAKYAELIRFWRTVLEQLSPETAAKLAYRNAEDFVREFKPIDAARCAAILAG